MCDNQSTNSRELSEVLFSGYRCDQSEDIKSKCHKLCKEYLGGVWRDVSIDNIRLTRITGGVTNQLYYCGVSVDVKPIMGEPIEVAIKFYGNKILGNKCVINENERFNDMVSGIILSENHLSPKIYGLFERGEIVQYYQHQQFQLKHQQNPDLVKKVSQKLAKFHSLKVPIKTIPNFLFEMFEHYYERAHQLFPINQLIDEYNCQTLKTIDLKIEIEWLTNLINHSNSPIVFSHFDFRGCNILVINGHTIEAQILFCDYEYSNYCNRGFDFGTIFMEWGRDLNELFDMKQFPNETELKPFLESYIEQSVKIYGSSYRQNENNSIDKLIYESKVFIFVRLLIACLMFMKMELELNSQCAFFSDKKQQMLIADSAMKSYLRLKKIFVDNEIEE